MIQFADKPAPRPQGDGVEVELLQQVAVVVAVVTLAAATSCVFSRFDRTARLTPLSGPGLLLLNLFVQLANLGLIVLAAPLLDGQAALRIHELHLQIDILR